MIELIKRKMAPALASFLRKLSLSSEIIGPARGYYEKIQDFLAAEQPLYVRYYKVYDAASDQNIMGTTNPAIDSLHWRFEKNKRYDFPEQYVLEINQGRVVGKDCYIISARDYVLSEVSRQFGMQAKPENIYLLKKVKLPRPKRLAGTIGVVGYAGADNYWHWMFDIIPRIQLLKKSGWLDKCDKIVINPLKHPFQKETIDALNIPHDRFIFSDKDLHIKAEKLIVPSIPEYKDHVPHWSVAFLKGLFSNEQVAVDDKKIYITRTKAKNRKVTNEQHVIDLLLPLGFKIVALEDLPVEEQAALFYSASVIIAPHGASQTNLIFCRPGTTIIELFSPLWVHYCYWSLSSILNLQYYYLMGEGAPVTEDNFIVDKGADIQVNIEQLTSILERTGIFER